MPLLERGSETRIINLSSAAQSPVSLEAVAGQEISNVNSAYAQSKLALTMWSFYLAKQQGNMTVIAVNPGSLLDTKMVAEAYGKHWSPATKGSDILYDLAVSDEYIGQTGKYFDNDKGNPKGAFGSAHPDAYDEDKIAALINKTEEKYIIDTDGRKKNIRILETLENIFNSKEYINRNINKKLVLENLMLNI